MLTKESVTMTAEEKFINNIRAYLIEENGEEFLELTEEEQNNLILATIHSYIEKMNIQNYIEKNEK